MWEILKPVVAHFAEKIHKFYLLSIQLLLDTKYIYWVRTLRLTTNMPKQSWAKNKLILKFTCTNKIKINFLLAIISPWSIK